jgi:membrane-bound serine protease (ClpP class)
MRRGACADAGPGITVRDFMKRVFLTLVAAMVLPLCVWAQDAVPVVETATPPAAVKTAPKNVVVIPMREGIDKPILYVLRRGLKEAIERKADVVVLDMETPGGRLDVTFDIMEALGRFEGETITFINEEAISAGAFISATTKEIWFAPRGIIGAAAAVSSGGAEIQETMQLKINSFLRAKIRAMSEGQAYRGAVISAMLDKDYELKVGDEVLKPKGELLTLTATEASKTYGDPPQALLAAGIANDVEDLLTQKYGAGNFQVRTLEVTWSEELATYLTAIAPILMGLGLLAIFIEFKTPGFGFFGIAGGVLLGIVFFGHYVAGFSGHEPALVFALGVLLVAVEIFFFPGVIVAAFTGVLLMLGALVWSMADLWPNEPVKFNSDVFTEPLKNMGLGLLVTLVLAVLLGRFMPRGWFWDRMVLQAAVNADSQAPEVRGAAGETLAGKRGVVATALMPSGQIEIDGRRYEARVAVGMIEAGAAVTVVKRSDFGLVVERTES